MEVNTVYLDHAATTPTAFEAAHAVWWCLTQGFGNPSSVHYLGVSSRALLNKARGQVAALIGAQEHEIIFTSGGTESNNLALRGVLEAAPPGGRRFVSAVEHSSILSPLVSFKKRVSVTILPVDDLGRVVIMN